MTQKLKIACAFTAVLCALSFTACDENYHPVGTPQSTQNAGNVEGQNPGQNAGQNTPLPTEKYTVIFDYNDGSGQTYEVAVPRGDTIDRHAPNSDREVTCWSSLPQGIAYAAPVTGNITVYAQWEIFTPVLYTDTIPGSVNDRIVQINASGDPSMFAGKVLRVGSRVERLTIVGDGAVYSDFTIIIIERNKDIHVKFDNFAYRSNQSTGLLAAGSGYCLNLGIGSTCSIDCSGVSANAEESGSTCISAPNLTISGNGTAGGHGITTGNVEIHDIALTIQGGDGGKGGKGTNNFPKTNKDGGDGGSGGNGGHVFSNGLSQYNALGCVCNYTPGNGSDGGDGGNSKGNTVLDGVKGSPGASGSVNAG